eukprot:COSAG01_NODE_43885_length_425_cov_0.628834_2_plen_90_part_01
MLGGVFEVRLFDLPTSGLFGLGEFVIVRRTVLAGNVGLDRGEVDGRLDKLVVVRVLLGRGEHLEEGAARAVAVHGSPARKRFPLRRGGFK